jgi:CDP-glucose 4,6-dehydratase
MAPEPHVESRGEVAGRAAVDASFWRGRRVLITGHTGFKGAWLTLWLTALGAEVTGFSNGAPTDPALYELARAGEGVTNLVGDVRDADAVRAAVLRSDPEVVIHMAAQSIVRRSLIDPRETYSTNIMGTVNVLDAVRLATGVRVLVNVTSDKCYENRGIARGYREDDPMGGGDPYASSKGCAELVTDAYRRSYFSDADGSARVRVASARAGNAIGGGDWSPDRLVPDVMRAALAGEILRVRNPSSVRPWQHVLNPLHGYLLLVQALWDGPQYARGWNFGPADRESRPVRWVVDRLASLWPGGVRWSEDVRPAPAEARTLVLDSTLARDTLGWKTSVGLDAALESTVTWYRAFTDGAAMREITLAQIADFQRALGGL